MDMLHNSNRIQKRSGNNSLFFKKKCFFVCRKALPPRIMLDVKTYAKEIGFMYNRQGKGGSYMAFLDKMTDFSRSAMKKSEEVMETAKINLKISQKKSVIKDYQVEIGKIIYTSFKNGELAMLCEKIKLEEEEMGALQESLENEA